MSPRTSPAHPRDSIMAHPTPMPRPLGLTATFVSPWTGAPKRPGPVATAGR